MCQKYDVTVQFQAAFQINPKRGLKLVFIKIEESLNDLQKMN